MEFARVWWNFWAGVTDLFDWDAIAALGTAIAVWVALDQAGRAKQIQNRHGTGVFTTLIGYLEPIPELLPYHADRKLNQAEARAVLADGLVARARAGIDRLQLGDTSQLGISGYLGALPLALEELSQHLPAVADGASDGRELDVHLGYIAEAVEEFRERRSMLQRGRLGTFIHRRVQDFRRTFERRLR